MKKTGKKVKDERSKGRGSAPASGGYPKVKSCSILLAMAMIFMLSVSLPAYATDATGGTITYDGNYKIHTFTGSGTLNVTESGNVEYLVVAGGGGGNNSNDLYSGGGGGAGGGVLSGTLAVSTGNLAVTVGDGGLTKSNGYNSVFSSITATGGVKGVYNTSNGAGANGNASTISGTSAYYAGGGGGGKSYYDNTPYPGGLGGGGRGGYQSQNGGWGTANTGGGGGGSSNQGSPGYGGSGIVIVRYEIQRFTITASSGDNGSISSTGATTVDFGASQSYVITPANSYRIVDVLIDGSSAGTGGAYTFTNVSANHTISATFDIGVNAYSITASAGANGTISPAGVTTKNQSASQTYFITPNSGYKISSVLIDGISVGTMAAYTFSNLNANHAISAVFAEKTYTFATGGTVTYDGNYKIHTFTDSGTLNVTQNGDAEYLVVAGGGAGGGSNASGGGGAGGFLNGMSSLSIGSKTVTVGSGGISSALTQGTNGSNSVFNSITAIGGGGGGINGGATRGSNGGSGGGTGNNTSAPPLGIGNELITGTGVPGQGYAGGEGSFGYSHGSGGGGAASAAFGSSPNHCEGCTVKINGGTGQVSSISGVSTYYAGGGGGGAACIYNDSGIGGLGGGGRGGYYGSSISAGISGSANTGGGGGGGGWGGGWTVALSALGGAGGSGIVIVRYELEHIAILSSFGANGSISPPGATTVISGASQSYTITPDNSYQISDVLVDGVSVGAVNTYTFSNVTANHTISATFITVTYTLTASSGANGSVSPTGVTRVTQGASQNYTITPAAGFLVADVLVDGVSVGAVSAYTFSDVSATHTISATFTTATYTLTASSGANGSITPSGVTPLNYGASQAYTIIPATGYKVADVFVDGSSVGAVTSYNFSNITANHTISVTFTEKTYVVATGGTVTYSGNYKMHTFTGSGTLTVTRGGDAEYLVVGGGGRGMGGGGSGSGYTYGGGGGGGVMQGSLSISIGNISVTVGAGENSSAFSSITAPPGGNGRTGSDRDCGGSGGASGAPQNNPGGILLPGSSGMTWYPYCSLQSGGGGGAGGAGSNTSGLDWQVKGHGGPGIATAISGTPVYYGAGGGGGASGWGAMGGIGGGGNETKNGTPNTGGGGGGRYNFGTPGYGGSGIVIVRYEVQSFTITASSGENGSITPSGVTTVNQGASQSYTITPATGYKVTDVLVDGVSVGAVNTYNFTDVSATHTISATFGVATHTITASSGTNGLVSPTGVTSVNQGASQSYTITPSEGYQVEDVLIDGSSVGVVTAYAFDNVVASHTISATFKVATYTIISSAGENGAISPSGPTSVTHGASRAYTITPATGYSVTDVLVDGVSVGAVSTYAFTNVSVNHTISAAFGINTYTIAASFGENGAISPSGSTSVTHGGSQNYTITPAANYSIVDVLVDGVSVGAVSTYEFTNVTAPHTISATFSINTYAIISSAGANGSITPSGSTSVTHGGSQTYTITTNEGYSIADVLVDGVSVGAVSTYEFTNVTAPHTISATFSINTYAIISSAGANGSITPSGSTSVTHGGSQAYTITPATNYSIVDILVDGASVGFPLFSVSTYEFTNVSANHTISATFDIATHTITASAGENGSITPSGAITVNQGTSQNYAITPSTGYQVADVLVDGVSVGAVSTYTFNNVAVSHTISATFDIITYTITASSGTNGSVSPTGVTSVTHGASLTYIVTPAANYSIADVLVDGVSVGAVSIYEFTDITVNHTISATFGINTYTITASSGENGSISPTGVASADYGASRHYTITPATNYSITDVLVDGSSVGAVSTYTFTNVSANHTISAAFDIVTHTITASAGENGSITPSGAITVNQGTSQNYAITPSTGYQVADVLVDGVSVGAVSTYTFNNVAVSHTISATFTYQLPTINSVSCPASLHTGQAGTCTVSASAAAGTLKYAWTVPGGSAGTPTDAITSVTFTTAGVKTVSVKTYIDEDVSVFATSNKTLTINGSDLTLSVNCPEAGSESQVLSCTAIGSSNWGEIAFLWNTDSGGNIVGANNTATATVAFSTGGNHFARVKMYLVEAPFIFIEKAANITVVVPPTIYNVGCNEEVYLGQPVNCFVSAGTLGGTLKLRWNAVDGQISALSASTTDIIFDTPGVKTVTVKASIMESPSIETNRQMQVNVLDNPITAEVTCPEEVISNETFTCTVQGNTPPWGTLAFDWLEGSSNKPVANGGSVNITANRDGTMLVRLVASLIESSTRRIEVKKTVKVIGEKNVIPVVTGARTVYIDAENTYKATAPCLTSAKCTVKWRHNGEETAGDTLNIIFTAPGKYELEVETTLAGTESVRTIKHVVNAVDFPRIPVSISGQKAVWVGEEYTYTAVIPLKFSGLNILTRWTLPDNSTVDGRQVTMTPTAEGTNTLQCEGWVDGHREETLRTAQFKITAVGYSFPVPKINVKKTEGLGPYNVTFKIDYTVKKIMGLQYRIAYNWNFGDGETLTTTNTIVHHLFKKIGTYNVTMTATDQYDNTITDNVTITAGTSLIELGFKVSASNKTMRAPLDIYIRSAIAGKTSLDRLESHVWKIDGVAVENTKSEYMKATFSEPGDHTVTFTVVMGSGATATDSVDITVVPNQPPTCTIDHILVTGNVSLKAKCTDPDGRISSYKWNLDDGRDYRNSSGNISFKAPVTRTYNIGLKATDDSGAEAEFRKEITVTR